MEGYELKDFLHRSWCQPMLQIGCLSVGLGRVFRFGALGRPAIA